MPQQPFARHFIMCLWLGIWGLICLPGMVVAQPTSPHPAVVEKTDGAVLSNAREDWVYQQFTDQNGLPQNSVEAICEWNQYVWVGTQDGIACYNGRQWQRVQFPKNILSTFVYALLPASDKSLWVGLNGGGVAHFKNGGWELFTTQTGHLSSNFVRTLYETQSPDGTTTIWVGTAGNGIMRYHQGQWTQVDMRPWLPTNNIRCFLETGQGETRRLWVGSLGGGLAYLEQGQWHRFEPADGKLLDPTVHCLLETSQASSPSRLWIGMESGLACVQNGVIQKVPIHSSTRPNSPVIALRETRNHRGEPRLWAATFSGVHCLVQNQWQQVGNIADNRQQVAISLLETTGINGESSIWVGFNSAGVSRIQKSSWSKFGLAWKPANNTITSLLETVDTDGTSNVWMGTNGSGLVRYRRGDWTLFDSQTSQLPDDVILSLLETTDEDGSKTLWVGMLRGGLVRFRNGQWTNVFPAPNGITSSRVFCILETRDLDGAQVLWFGTRNGLIRYKNDQWTAIGNDQSALVTNSIYCLAETTFGDGSKAIWAGTNVGLFRFYQDQWTIFDTTKGLPNNQVRDVEQVLDFVGKRSLWIATRGGVATLDLEVPTAEIIPLASTEAPPVGNNVVYRIQQDAQRRIYLSTLRGITRFSPRTPTSEQPSPYFAYTYTTEDGLPSNECNAGASMIDRAGRLWFGTIGGATFFDPTQEIPDLMAKPLRLESLLINGSPLFQAQGLTQLASEWNTGHEFAHDENNIVIEYSLLSYFREPDSQYCTQLVGLQTRPTPWTTEAKTVYTTLPQGHYRFKVWGRDYAGNISGPVEIGFTIRPAPWVTWWAFVLYAGVVGGLGYSSYQWRVFRFRQANAQLEAKIRERTAALAKSEALTKEKAEELARLVTKLSISEQQAQDAKEEALVQRQQALEASKAKSLFLANMSHELRTPLNAILGFVQLLNRVPGRSDEDREYLGIIIRSGEHLLNLINNILSLSKIEAGQIVLEEKTFDLRMLLTELEGLFRFRAQTKHLRFVIEFAPELPRFVVGDERKLRQVLINLLGNAFKFTERGEVKLKVGYHQELAAFEVSDTGAGIAPAEIEKIFQPFTQTQSGLQAQEGTGLGLTISQDFVKVMGGEITVESQSGRGTTFRFAINLPAVMVGATSIKPKTVIGLATGQPVFRLLVVDDMVENRQLLTTLLKQLGFDVQDAANGAEALIIWQNWRPHLVWMDMHMPVLDGFEATRQIRATESAGKSEAPSSTSAVPTWIISISASAFDADRTAILEAGCDDIVIKPFSTDVIVEKLVKYLGVEFTYESSSEITTETHQACGQPESLKQAIASLSPELRTQLYEAVLGCNREKVYGVAEQIHSVDPTLAQELHHLARQYQFEELLSWFE